MRTRIYLILAAAIALAGLLHAQAQKTPAPKPAAELNVDEVIKLAKASVSDDLIVALIRKNGKAFTLTTQDVLRLKQASVSDNVIKAMLDPASSSQPVAAPPEPPASQPASLSDLAPAFPGATPAVAAAPDTGPPTPDETGIYWLKDGRELVRIENKALSNIRTGNMLTSSLTLGIKRMRINAQLKGPRAEIRIPDQQPRFYLYLPEDATPGDYLLLRLVQQNDVRQLELGESRFFKVQAGVDHEAEVEFSQQRIRPRLYLVTPKAAMQPGEYGFYPAAGVTDAKKPAGRIYDFAISAPER